MKTDGSFLKTKQDIPQEEVIESPRETYEKPVIEVIEVQVEAGFAGSGNTPGWDDNGPAW